MKRGAVFLSSFGLRFGLAFSVFCSLCAQSFADGAWRGEVPAQARDPKVWAELLSNLRRDGMPYGAMAASARMLTFFSELPVKEAAYEAVIELMDQGYPFPVGALFVPGDLDARGGFQLREQL